MDRKAQILAELARAEQGLPPGKLAARLGISRQAVSRHLARMLETGEVTKHGRTRNTRYRRATRRPVLSRLLVPPFPDEDAVYEQHFVDALGPLPKNVSDICRYAFTEMLNNAIDHADARQIAVRLLSRDRDDVLHFVVADDGVGCFENVRRKAKLLDHADAIAHLSKGKQTTAPAAHSGEGIFFCSKVVDLFTLQSDRLRWQVDNLRDDVAVGEGEVDTGTTVSWQIGRDSRRSLEAVFNAYATENFAFDRTRIHVKLFERGEAFISRSEAKRLLAGLEAFEEIILDYKGVRIVGQGFADEIYRVYPAANAGKRLISINAPEPVAMMIRRAGGVVS